MNNRYKSVAVIKDDAKGFLNGKYGIAVGIVMIYAIIAYAVEEFIVASFNEILLYLFAKAGIVSDSGMLSLVVIENAVSFIVSIMLSVFLIGMSLVFLKIGCNQRPAAKDLFAGFKEDFRRSFYMALGVNGPILLAVMPGYIALEYYMNTTDLNSFFVGTACLAIGTVISIFYSLSFQMSYFIMHDFPDYSVGEVLKACWKKMKGNRARLLGLELSFIPYILLAIVTLGIGLIWVYPLMFEARALFYLDLMNPKKISDDSERTV